MRPSPADESALDLCFDVVEALEFRHFARRRRERKVAPGGAQRHQGVSHEGVRTPAGVRGIPAPLPGCNIPVTVTPGCARFARLTRG